MQAQRAFRLRALALLQADGANYDEMYLNKPNCVSYLYYDFLSYIFSVSEEYKDYTFDYDDMAG